MSDQPRSTTDIVSLLRFDAEQRQIFELAGRYSPCLPSFEPVIRSRGGLQHLRHEIQSDLAGTPAPAIPPGDPAEAREAAWEVADVGATVPEFGYYPPWKRWIARKVTRVVLFLIGTVTHHQRLFNRAVLRLIDRLGHDLAHERRERLFRNDQLLDLLEAGEVVESGLVDIDRRLEEVENRLGEVSHIAGLDSRLHEIERRVAELASHTEATVREARLGFPTPEARNTYYLAFEDRFRGSAEVIRQRLEVYAPRIDALSRETSDLAIDLGAGRGEWLDLLTDHGFRAIGVDLNARMVEACRERGHEAIVEDALDFLERQEDDSAVLISSFHLIEHLSFEYLVSLVDETLRVLCPGGIALFETPNPENVFTSSCYFHMDFTHVRPIPPESARFLLEQRGFSDVEILPQDVLRIEQPPIEPVDAEHPLASRLNPALEMLNKRFLGSPDYAVLGRKNG